MNFQNEFERETQHLPVPDTEIATVITTARSRTRRRRVAVSTLAAGVLIAGTAVGIQQLSTARHADTDFAVPPTPAPEPSSTESTTATVETNDAVTATTVSGWSLSSDDTDPTMAYLQSKATPAQAVPADITWTVLDANSPEALAYQFDATQRYALATVPATSPVEMDKLGLFEQVNGSWNQLPFEYPEGIDPMMAGDTVLGIGRAPATPGGPAGSFGTFDIASGTWRLHELPADVGVYETDALTTEMYYQAVPIDDGLIAYVSTWIRLRSDKVQQMFNNVSIGPLVDGNSVVAFNDCNQSELDAAVTEEASDQDIFLELARKYCTEESIDASEFGMTQADLDAYERSLTGSDGITLWKVTADSMVPFDVPGHSRNDPTSYVGLDGEQVIVSGNAPNAPTTVYQIDHDGSLHQVFKDLTGDLNGYSTGSKASPDYSTVIGGLHQFLLTERSGGPTQITDVLKVITTPDMIHPDVNVVPVGLSGQLSVFNAQLTYDPPGTLAEQKSLSDSGYTLQLNVGQGPGSYDVIEDATGAPPEFAYGLSTESGKVRLERYPDPSMFSEDSQAASMTDDSILLATFDIDWRTMPGFNMKWRSNVLTTTDGVNVAISDIETILRQNVTVAENETVSTGSTRVFNGRILAKASVYAPVESADSSEGPVFDTERRYLIVGTPN